MWLNLAAFFNDFNEELLFLKTEASWEGEDFVGTSGPTIDHLESIGMGNVPVCIAKTQYSFSDNPKLLGRPTGFRISVREVTPSAGAGFVVAKTGSIMTMPGLALHPASEGMSVSDNGEIVGLT